MTTTTSRPFPSLLPPSIGPHTLYSLLKTYLACEHPIRCRVKGAIEVIASSPEAFTFCGACGAVQVGAPDEPWISPAIKDALCDLDALEALGRLRAFAVEGLELPALAECAAPSQGAAVAIVRIVEALSEKLVGKVGPR